MSSCEVDFSFWFERYLLKVFCKGSEIVMQLFWISLKSHNINFVYSNIWNIFNYFVRRLLTLKTCRVLGLPSLYFLLSYFFSASILIGRTCSFVNLLIPFYSNSLFAFHMYLVSNLRTIQCWDRKSHFYP